MVFLDALYAHAIYRKCGLTVSFESSFFNNAIPKELGSGQGL